MTFLFSQPRVLVVDDEPFIRKFINDFLTLNNFTVEEAANGAEAWRRLQTQALPSVILLDLNMPLMNGFEMLKKMQPEPLLRKCPVIVMTASSETQDIIRMPNVVAVLTKPFSLDLLTSAITNAIAVSA